MKKAIGSKLISFKPSTLAAFIDETGITPSTSYDLSDDGYLVEYPEDSKSNTELYKGYVSWSPKAVFDAAYRPVDGLSFGLAIEALKKGLKVARAGWNGKGMYLQLNPGFDFEFSQQCQFFQLKNVQNNFDVWQPSTSDCLANDWQILE